MNVTWRMIKNVLYLFLLSAIACSPVSKHQLTRTFRETELKFQDHTGFVLYDVGKRKTVFSYNGEKYFTPASNTKIFTFYAGLTLLGDSIPGLYYTTQGDSLIFWGTGDPSFLYDQGVFSNSVYTFLENSSKQLYFSASNFQTTHLGSGWAWSDYLYAYSAERSALPLYGNTYTVTQPSAARIRVTPAFFKSYFWLADSTTRGNIIREIGTNRTDYYPGRNATSNRAWRVPFRTDALVITQLLEDTLKRPVNLLARPLLPPASKQTVYSVPADSVYKSMMLPSDNFIAEQLLLVCAGVLTDTLNPEITIRYMKKNHLADLPDEPVWVDGSGLSRFNLFTPRSIVKLWEKIYDQVDRERLFPMLAIGGKTGTLRNAYRNDPPYIFGKTGTLRNNHLLSGYLITKKGDVLIFSFMNNHFKAPASDIRAQMEVILKNIYDNY
jgi:serine-type D-Ala-D-Ala carboxypeptidase/endopeptidase (penicillin-binding protein 4)